MTKKAINNKSKTGMPHASDDRDDDDLDDDEQDDDEDKDDDEDEAEEDERPPKKDSKKSSSKPTAKPAAKKRPTTATVEQRRLDQLIEHPLQSLYNDGLDDHALKKLAADIEMNGLREMIQTIPENEAGLTPDTIPDGHQRLKALRLLGQTKTNVNVLYKFAQADAITIEKAFLGFNTNRQHRDPLLQARTALRLYEIERKRPRGQLRQSEEGEARDRVGKTIGMGGRNFSRHFRVLKTPVEVQNAFRAGKLPLIVAEKVADFDAKTQEKVAARIKAGEDPKAVVADYLPHNDGRHRKPNDALAGFLKNLLRGRQDLDGRLDKVGAGVLRNNLDELRQAHALIAALIKKAGK